MPVFADERAGPPHGQQGRRRQLRCVSRRGCLTDAAEAVFILGEPNQAAGQTAHEYISFPARTRE